MGPRGFLFPGALVLATLAAALSLSLSAWQTTAAVVAPPVRLAIAGRSATVDTDHDTNSTLPSLVRQPSRPTGRMAMAAGTAMSVDTDHDTNSSLPSLA
ncbi:hypothetical protein BU14_2109s0001 [Porphyra umbilicalis]|uniref:Secreted protein n=1 Tax=Porphyra umbilicalis TaxID=2786 RepID=A0A1X6NJY0_PORUM|nr:hypothetical protein BU14_2109s0001 [Porphyra umbilicalis]|eukprot:OSX68908.1 hypothetical protein BU14_2109s0001 [Porphyra umbilicalis]